MSVNSATTSDAQLVQLKINNFVLKLKRISPVYVGVGINNVTEEIIQDEKLMIKGLQ